MNNNERFIAVYKDFENLMKNKGIMIKDFEDSMSDSECANKLRICRQMRNYISHNSDTMFLTMSEAQIKFIENLTHEQRMFGDVVKKHLGTIAANTCKIGDKCSDVVLKMSKKSLNEFPVYTEVRGKRIFGVITIHDLIIQTLNSKTNKISSIKKMNLNKVNFVAPDELMENIPKDKVNFCTDDGTKNGKLLGVVII